MIHKLKTIFLVVLVLANTVQINAIKPEDIPWLGIVGAAGAAGSIIGFLARGKNYEAERDKEKRKLIKAQDEHEQHHELKQYVKNLNIINQKYSELDTNILINSYAHREFSILELSSELEHDLNTAYGLKLHATEHEQAIIEKLIKNIRNAQAFINSRHKDTIAQQRKAFVQLQEQNRLANARASVIENQAKAELAKKECFETLEKKVSSFLEQSKQQLNANAAQCTAFFTAVTHENATLFAQMKKMITEHSMHTIKNQLRTAHDKLDELRAQQSHGAQQAHKLAALEKEVQKSNTKINEIDQKVTYMAHVLEALRSSLTAPSAPPRDF